MKYFTKYLPIEGEIKELDYYKHPNYPDKLFRFYKPWDYKKEKAQKVALFLCSRNINYLDKFYFKDSKEMTNQGALDSDDRYWVSDGKILYSKSESFKVIGEISPEAIWVKEGDEFEEEDLESWLYCILHPDESIYMEINELIEWNKICIDHKRFVPRIKIKCPTCNKFH